MSWQEELQAMVAAYDGNGTFVEFAERYLHEHPSQYDFSTAIKYVVIEPKRKPSMSLLVSIVKMLLAEGFMLSEVVSVWNDVVEGKE